MQLDVELKKSFSGFSLDVAFSLSNPRTGLFGPSGCGKSTIMSLLAGLNMPDHGTIALDGRVLFDSRRGINCRPEARGIGIVFQHAHLFPHMSVKGNLLYGFKRTKPENRRVDADNLFRILGIESLMSRSVVTLSGGERQRIALARTVLACPQLIMMDEPLSALDEGHKFQIIPYLNSVFAEFGIPILFISHSVLEMRLMTEEVLVLEKGRVRQQTSTDELARRSWNGGGGSDYVNLLNLREHGTRGTLHTYCWGERNTLVLSEPPQAGENLFELDSSDILLFKRHPEATSARNLLQCTVVDIFASDNRVRVELACGSERLVAQVVPESIEELGVEKGGELVAAIKASAFRRLF